MTTNWTRKCRVAGQGLVEGIAYTINDLWWEDFGRNMIITHAKAVDSNGVVIEIKNAHIAFDLEDIIGDVVSA